MKTFITLMGIFVLCPNLCSAQFYTVSGYIKSSISADTIENVNVFESISGIGTISNGSGYFKLMLNEGEKNIDFSVNGYKNVSKKLFLTKDTSLMVILVPAFSETKQRQEHNEMVTKASKKLFGRQAFRVNK